MITESLPARELFIKLHEPVSELLNLLSSNTETGINTVPFKNSWTAAQVADHITKSTSSIAKAMNMESAPTERDPGERIQELKKMFLDFTVKFKSPEFILPSQDVYEKELLIGKLSSSFDQLKERADTVNLSGMITHPAFGDITKLELLYFVLYHTKRHLRQVKNILLIVESK